MRRIEPLSEAAPYKGRDEKHPADHVGVVDVFLDLPYWIWGIRELFRILIEWDPSAMQARGG